MTKSQDVIANKLPQLLQNLPSQGCFQFCLTEEQKECFEKMRESNLLVAQALEARFTGKESLFEQVLENQGIDPLKIEAIRKTAEEYTVLWEVVKLAEPYLNKFYTETATLLYQKLQQKSSPFIRFMNRISSKILSKKYEFTSAEELFESIIEEEQEMIFMDSVGLSNIPFSVNKTRDILTIFKTCSFLNPDIEVISPSKYKSHIMKAVDYINCNQLYYSWKEMIFFVCFYYLGANPKKFNKKLFFNLCQYYKLIFFDIIPLVLTALRKRDSKTWKKPRSYRWNNGHKIYTTRKAESLLLLNESKEKNYKDLEKENEEQKSEIEYLKMVIQDREQKIKELECLQDPYSYDGDAICNSDSH